MTEKLAASLGRRRPYALIDTVDTVESASARWLASTTTGYDGHLVYVMHREEAPPTLIFTSAVSVHEVALNAIHGFGSAADWRDRQGADAGLVVGAASGRLWLPSIRTDDFEMLPDVLASMRDGVVSGELAVTLQPQAS